MSTPLFTFDQLPKTSGEAIRIFDERYLAALSATAAPSWARDFGDMLNVESPKVTFPIGLLSTKFLESKGENRAKDLGERSFDIKTVEYDAGYEARLLDITKNVYAYRKWAEVPSRFVLAEGRHINSNIATLIEDGLNQDCWDGKKFFATDHPANPDDDSAGSFSNYQSSGADVSDITKLEAEVTAMRGVLDENGQKLGLEPDTILVPTAKYQKVVNILKQDLIASAAGTATIRNPFLGMFNVVHVPEFTDVNDWYLVDSKLIKSQGLAPWAALKYQVPQSLGLRFFDETSDFYKSSGKLKVTAHIWYGFGLVMPHAIRKIVGA